MVGKNLISSFMIHITAASLMDNDEARWTLSVQHFAGYDTCVTVDNNMPSYILIRKAYGTLLIHSDGGCCSSVWCQRWSVVVQHRGQHYSPTGGSLGRQTLNSLIMN